MFNDSNKMVDPQKKETKINFVSKDKIKIDKCRCNKCKHNKKVNIEVKMK